MIAPQKPRVKRLQLVSTFARAATAWSSARLRLQEQGE
jgi:hypothetical protein